MQIASSAWSLSASLSLHSHRCFLTHGFRRDYSVSMSSKRNHVSILSLTSKSRGQPFLLEALRQQNFPLAAAVGDTVALSNEFLSEQVPCSGGSDQISTVGISAKKNTDQEGAKEGPKLLDDDNKIIRVCDKLIGVFMVDKPTPTDWRKLLAFSKTWDNIRPHFFSRCLERADAEDNPDMQHKLFRLRRKLKEIDEDVQRHNELLKVIRGAPSEINAVVARRRKDFTQEFFEHLYTVTQSYNDNPVEQDALVNLAHECLDALQAYDDESESSETIDAAKLKLRDIMNSPFLDAGSRKIDSLADIKFDPSLATIMQKAWSDGKGTNIVEEEAKDIMLHLYQETLANMQRDLPTEVRILKYLLDIQDPERLLSSLNDAFTRGPELEREEIERGQIDYLYTTPQKLHALICSVVNGYYTQQKNKVIPGARDLLRPSVVQRLVALGKIVQDKFM